MMRLFACKVKQAFRDQLGFTPLPGSTEWEPLLEIPDGEYEVEINGGKQVVRVVGGCFDLSAPFQPAAGVRYRGLLIILLGAAALALILFILYHSSAP